MEDRFDDYPVQEGVINRIVGFHHGGEYGAILLTMGEKSYIRGLQCKYEDLEDNNESRICD